MCTNPQETADLVTFTEEILNGKLHFLYSVSEFDTISFMMLYHNVQLNEVVTIDVFFCI